MDSLLAEGKHLTKIQKQLKRQREELQRTQDETRSLLVETRLKAEYPDIEKVVSADNIKALSELYPEIAQTLNASSDYYSKAKAAYTMIKKFGIHVEDNYSSEREAVAKNAAKPRPLASVSPQQADSPLSRANAFANGLTEELKARILLAKSGFACKSGCFSGVFSATSGCFSGSATCCSSKFCSSTCPDAEKTFSG